MERCGIQHAQLIFVMQKLISGDVHLKTNYCQYLTSFLGMLLRHVSQIFRVRKHEAAVLYFYPVLCILYGHNLESGHSSSQTGIGDMGYSSTVRLLTEANQN